MPFSKLDLNNKNSMRVIIKKIFLGNIISIIFFLVFLLSIILGTADPSSPPPPPPWD